MVFALLKLTVATPLTVAAPKFAAVTAVVTPPLARAFLRCPN